MAALYFGSVRFFKHMILGTIALLILVPTTLAIVFGVKLQQLTGNGTAKGGLVQPVYAASEVEGAETEEERTEPSFPYQALYPELYVKHTTSAYPENDENVYLTFDDGPSEVTTQVLDTLAAKNVKATFFVVGKNLTTDSGKALLRRIADEGHAIGIHTYNHSYRDIYSSVDAYLKDFYETYALVKEITGVSPTVFRFPGGSFNGYNALTAEPIIAEMTRRGFTYFDWNVSSGDAQSGSVPAASLISNVVSQVQGCSRSVVLMHDGGGKQTSADALGPIIDQLAALGYQFATLTNEVKPVIFGYR